MSTITISYGELLIPDCGCALVVPEKAITEPGYIKALSARSSGQGKHEFHALAQTAYYQFQDDELDITSINDPVRLEQGGESEVMAGGMVIFRDSGGTMKAIYHEGQRAKKLLESANRYCTRWVRLDI
jgi:hypothetical protein